VRNESSFAHTYHMTFSGYPERASLTGNPSQFTLDAGASVDVTIEIAVDPTLRSPEDASMAITGLVQIVGTHETIRLPWAVLRAYVLNVQYREPDPASVSLTNERVSRWFVLHPERPEGEMLVPSGTFEIGAVTKEAVVVFERKVIEDDQVLVIDPAMATHAIAPRMFDEGGREIGTISQCSREIQVKYPGGLQVDSLTQSVGGLGLPAIRTSDMSNRYRLILSAGCEPIAPPAPALYIAQFPALHGITAGRTIANDPAQWLRQDVRFEKPPNAAEEPLFVRWTFNQLFPSRLYTSTHGIRVVSHFQSEPIRFFLHAETETDAWTTGSMSMGAPFPLIESAPLRVVDGRIVASRFVFDPPPTRYVPPPSSLLTIGDGPVYPQLSGIFLEGDWLSAGARWSGPLDEDRLRDYSHTTVFLREANGNTIAQERNGYRLPSHGVYSLEVFNRGGSVAGIASLGTLWQRFDTRLPDFEPPTVTALRIVDAQGVQTSRLTKNTQGELLFAAADYARNEEPVRYQRVRSEKTAVSWRPHGNGPWQPLVSTEILEDKDQTEYYFSGIEFDRGILYRVPLEAPTCVSGAIDLRIAIEDPSGNVTEWTMEPGLIVGDSKRRAVRH
jgi:hypothetical protein